ncbi:MAG: asparagine synthase (glutamine-hydrolyzing), partial [Bacteroidetes bacterium]|nr:asparagine synthase (glutamine-hydrolyzing) [Bacteroidota bacterium]
MCGIAGIFKLNNKMASETEIRLMTHAVAHRGPDGEGHFLHENVSLGHKRLAILDTSDKGLQPMQSRNGEWVITFNGCIYNFQELKEELSALGHSFISNTDTEVITEGLAEYGVGFFKRLNGMFAVGAYNKVSKQLYLSRDRYGVKPLYYYFGNNILLFCSEIKGILAFPGFKNELNLHSLNEYFTFQNQFTYTTLFKNIFMLPAANTVCINEHTKEVIHNPWWDYDFSEPDEKMTFEDSVSETKRLFQQAVKRQMLSDVPVGSYLSGGMDSGSITAIASSHVNRLTTFTCGFDMSEVTGVEANYDERRDAELMANYFKTEHYEQIMNAGDLKWSLPKVVYHIEDLRVGISYPNYY